MKLIDNILYIEFTDFITASWSPNTIKSANLRNGPYWQMLADPQDKRKVLVQFDTLRPKDKDRLTTHFGNPYEYISKEPIKKLVEADHNAEIFFKDYRYDNGKILPFEHQVKYTIAASWLNMLIKLNTDKKFTKKELGITLEKFWLSVCDIIKADNIDLPSSYRRLLSKIDDYKATGYTSLIDWRFGNKLSAKIGKGENGFDPEIHLKQTAFIRKAASMHQNFDAQQVTSFCNPIFEKNGWPTVSRATVYNMMRQYEHLTLAGSRGKREYQNTVSMQHKRRKPDYPLFYFTLDGWDAELLYQEGTTYHNRLVAVIVLDAFNNYPIGYAIGDRENTDLIRQANRNASQHIHELFGDYYQPRQLQSDHYGIKNLTPFYQAMSHLHTPAAVGNAKSKVIEPYFNSFNKKYCQRMPNWSGFNVTSKKANQPNVEWLNKIKKTFPERAGVVRQIEMIIAQERKIKLREYLEAWHSCPANEKLIMSKMDRLMVYGKEHAYTNTITGHGMIVTLQGERLYYDSFDPAFRELQYTKWQIVFDEADLSSVLAITEDYKHRFLLERKRELPMDVHSMVPADHEYSSRIHDFNKKQMDKVMNTYITDDAAVAEVMNNTILSLNNYDEASIKLMFTTNGQQKEAIQDAKGLKKIQVQAQKAIAKNVEHDNTNWQNLQQEYLTSKTDFNQYID